MKITLERREFQRLLSFARSVRQPLVSLFADDRLTVQAGDFTLSIRASMDARIHEPGACAVPATTLWHCVAGLKTRDVTLKTTSSCLVLASAGEVRFAIDARPPLGPQVPGSHAPAVSVACPDLIELLKSVLGFAALDHANPLLSCVRFRFEPGALALQASDGHRFAMGRVDVAGDFAGDFAIPPRALDVLLAGLPSRGRVALRPAPHQLVFSWGRADIVARAYDGKYPDIEALLPRRYARSLRVERGALIAAVKHVMPPTVSRVQVRLEPERVCLRGRTDGVAVSRRVPAILDGRPLRLAIEGKGLLQILQTCRGDEVCIDFVDERTMLRVRGAGGIAYMLVPLIPRAWRSLSEKGREAAVRKG